MEISNNLTQVRNLKNETNFGNLTSKYKKRTKWLISKDVFCHAPSANSLLVPRRVERSAYSLERASPISLVSSFHIWHGTSGNIAVTYLVTIVLQNNKIVL